MARLKAKWILVVAAAIAICFFVSLLFPSGNERTSPSGCVRRQFSGADDYIAKMKTQGLTCKVVETAVGAEGIPEGCDANGIARTLLISCFTDSGFQEGRAAYETSGAGVVEFTAPGVETGKMRIPVSEHCRYLVFNDPGEYAGKQEMAGFQCMLTNESNDIYGITPVCREFMYGEAQRDAGLELSKTIYFNCTLSGNMTNMFSVYQTANGSFVFFGELK